MKKPETFLSSPRALLPFLSPSLPCEDTVKNIAIGKPGKKPLLGLGHAVTLILDFPAPRAIKNKCICLSHPSCDALFVTIYTKTWSLLSPVLVPVAIPTLAACFSLFCLVVFCDTAEAGRPLEVKGGNTPWGSFIQWGMGVSE